MDFSTLSGALAYQHIRSLIDARHIFGASPTHLQPSSLDLSLSQEIYRMRGSYLPRTGERVRTLIKEGSLYETSFNEPLELNSIYLVRLNETLVLPPSIYAFTNNKSSTGRVNLQTRLLLDGVSAFDSIPAGYTGELWLEIIPKSFPVKLCPGERLNQIRFFASDTRLSTEEHLQFHAEEGFLFDAQQKKVFSPQHARASGITMSIDLTSQDIIGYVCRPTNGKVLDYQRRDYASHDFFSPIFRTKKEELVLQKEDFYILVTKEGIRVPPHYAVEMAPYDVGKGEFRSHYAGFFDPGFGYRADGSVMGSPAVLEVFTHDNDFILRDGQPICTMVYEKLSALPEVCYGEQGLGSNYFAQRGPKLSKHFSS